MKEKQISVFAENKPGILSNIVELLGDADIDIRALSLADTADFGIARMIVSDTQKALDILKENGFAVKCTEVVSLDMDDTPGGLSRILKTLKANDISVEYLYAFVDENGSGARVVMRVDKPELIEKLF